MLPRNCANDEHSPEKRLAVRREKRFAGTLRPYAQNLRTVGWNLFTVTGPADPGISAQSRVRTVESAAWRGGISCPARLHFPRRRDLQNRR